MLRAPLDTKQIQVAVKEAALVAAVYFWLPQANLRVTTGPPGSTAYRFITAFASVTEATHPRIHIKLVQVADLAASAKAIEDHATDLGIVRSDAVIPTNGASIAILRRDVVAFVVPAKSPIDKVSALAAGPSASRKDHCKLTTNTFVVRPGLAWLYLGILLIEAMQTRYAKRRETGKE